jgi:lipoate-protein ligase A
VTRPSTRLDEHPSAPSALKEADRPSGVLPGGNDWSYIVDEPRSPRWNMAVDNAILNAVVLGRSRPTLRFYRWSRPAVTLGFHQKIDRVLDVAAVKRAGIEVVVRPTGGRAVLHGDDLTYSIALPRDTVAAYGITELYKLLSEALREGFRQMGIEVELARGNRGELGPGPQPCFASTARYELVVGGKKLVGSAQRRYRGGVLQQGSIPLRAGRIHPEDITPQNHGGEKNAHRWTTVEDVTGQPVHFETLAHTLASGFAERLCVSMTHRRITQEELKEAADLVECDA